MRARTAISTVTAALLLAALVGCSSSGDDSKPAAKPSRSTSAPSAGKKTELAPVWTPKLETASEGATAACNSPSSTECAEAIDRIMAVVSDVDTAIEDSGQRYPQSTAQIVKMQDAEKVYVEEGCEGDPAADDPNSNCHGIATITVGAFTLTMTLATDDVS